MQSRDLVTQIYTFSMKYLTYINLFVTQLSVQTFALAKLYFQRKKKCEITLPSIIFASDKTYNVAVSQSVM